jgi:hypothetical protein
VNVATVSVAVLPARALNVVALAVTGASRPTSSRVT